MSTKLGCEHASCTPIEKSVTEASLESALKFFVDEKGKQDDSGENSKCGTFDWIIDYRDLKPFLEAETTGLKNEKAAQQVLVVGCGTSRLSEDLSLDGYAGIHSVDNDADCIRYMASRYSPMSVLKWSHYDIVEKVGSEQELFASMSNNFDLVVDKGTFDAILVEGSCVSMIAEIWRLLKADGVYIMCSLNSLELLELYFSIDGIGFECQFHTSACAEDGGHSNMTGNIVICKKKSTIAPDIALLELEQHVMDTYFQMSHPLLTPALKQILRTKFLEEIRISNETLPIHSPSNNCFNNPLVNEGKEVSEEEEEEALLQRAITVGAAHRILFSVDERVAYTFDLFSEDLQDFELEIPLMMNFAEAVLFLQTKQ